MAATSAAVLQRLSACGIVLRAEGDRLLFHPKAAMNPGLLALVAEQKAELIERLQSPWAGWLPYLRCPWCGEQAWLHPVPAGVTCLSCLRFAFRDEGGVLTRLDYEEPIAVPTISILDEARARADAEIEQHDAKQAAKLRAAREARYEVRQELFS